MNYQRIYDQIVQRAQLENRKKSLEIYYEEHHILPRCLGGSDNKENLVLLTAREHFICHKLLVEIYIDNKKLIYCLWMMTTMKNRDQQRNYRISSREYERLRVQGGGIPSQRGRHHSEETKKRISISHIGKHSGINNSQFNKHPSEETRLKLSRFQKLRIRSSESRLNQSKALLGKCKSKLHKEALSKAHLKKDKLTCPHCQLQGRNSVMYRWHFDHCKQKPK